MSNNISANVLFHFTRSLDNILDILTSGFYPHYCPEYSFGPVEAQAAWNGFSPAHATPMVCFCDLPLSLIQDHLWQYGKFAIGLDKQWGIMNGLAPVFYTHEQSQTFKPLSDQNWAARTANDSAAINDLILLRAYMKPIRGNAWRRGKMLSDVPFYDEREWRYVPHLSVGEELCLSREDYTNESKVKSLEESLRQNHRLRVHPDNIQYLIVPDDSHILGLVKHLGSLYNPDDVTLVTTTIMTTDCITEDV